MVVIGVPSRSWIQDRLDPRAVTAGGGVPDPVVAATPALSVRSDLSGVAGRTLLDALADRHRDRRTLFPRTAGFLLAGFAAFLPAALLFSPRLGMIAWLLLLPAALLDVLPRSVKRAMLPIWLISWFAVPPPFQWDAQLLQLAAVANVTSDRGGAGHVGCDPPAPGNTFEVPGQQFFVEDACSGIHSLLSLIGLALLFAVYTRLPVLASLCFLGSAAAAAIALNCVRVLAVVLAYTQGGLDLSTGWRHELLGAGLFVIALLFLVSAQQFWLFWFSPINVNASQKAANPTFRRDDVDHTVAVASDRSVGHRVGRCRIGSVGTSTRSLRPHAGRR